VSNVYPSWWNQTITVFNKYEHPDTRVITWYKTILTGCFWKYTTNKITMGDTTLETNVTLCRVPVNPMFKERYEWEKLTANVRGNFFTFGPGDIIVKGEVADTVNEYEAGKRSSDLMKKYKRLQGCMLIEACSINTGGGRGSEHYLVRGT